MTTKPAPTINVIVPNGEAQGPWPTGWTYSDPSDVRAYIETDGVAGPDLVLNVDYSLTASNSRENGGEILLSDTAVPLGGWRPEGPAPTRLIVRRWTARRQDTALPDVAGHKPRATELALDRAMRIAEELSDQQNLAVAVPPGGTPPSAADVEKAALASHVAQQAASIATEAANQVLDKADTDAGNIGPIDGAKWPARIFHKREDHAAVAVSAASLFDRIARTPSDFGALPVVDVAVLTQDDTPVLQAMIDGAFNDLKGANPGKSGGGTVRIDRVYRINQPLYLRKWMTLEGVTPGGTLLGRDEHGNNLDKTGKTLASVPGTIICGPQGKIVPKDCCTIRNLRILSDAGAKHPTNGSITTQLAEIQAFNGYSTAIEPEYGAGDVTVSECFIVGFQLGVRLNYNERFRILDNKFDCINGILFTDIYDTPRIERNSFWPYFIAHRLAPNTPGQAELVTPYGTCIKAALMPLPGRDRSSDGAQIIGNLVTATPVASTPSI